MKTIRRVLGIFGVYIFSVGVFIARIGTSLIYEPNAKEMIRQKIVKIGQAAQRIKVQFE